MDNTNPLLAFDKSNSDINRVKKDIIFKNSLPTETTSSFNEPSRMDFKGIFDKKQSEEISLSDQDINIQDTHKQVGDELLAKYPVYRKDIDNNEFYAQRQSTGEINCLVDYKNLD